MKDANDFSFDFFSMQSSWLFERSAACKHMKHDSISVK